MKHHLIVMHLCLLLACLLQSCSTPDKKPVIAENNRIFADSSMKSIHQYKVKAWDGGELNLADFAGKKLLIVNVASECGYTPQYQQLEELYKTHGDKVVVIGFPCNDFGGQEPHDAATVHQFCTRRFGVTFPLTEKISIKGDAMHPIYQWLTRQSLNGVQDSKVAWNFHKYLINEKGALIADFPSATSPLDERILKHIVP